MLNVTTLSRSFSLLVLAASLGTAACTSQIIGGGTGGDGAGGGGGAGGEGGVGGTTGTGQGGEGGTVVVGPPSAVAKWADTVTPTDPGSGGAGGASTSGSSTGGPPPPPPGGLTLNVVIGNYGPFCDGGFPYNCTSQTTWQVTIGLPPAYQTPGTYNLSDTALNSFFSETGANEGPDASCWGGGGSFINGTIQVESIDTTTIVVRLAGTDGFLTDASADGEYTAPICLLTN